MRKEGNRRWAWSWVKIAALREKERGGSITLFPEALVAGGRKGEEREPGRGRWDQRERRKGPPFRAGSSPLPFSERKGGIRRLLRFLQKIWVRFSMRGRRLFSGRRGGERGQVDKKGKKRRKRQRGRGKDGRPYARSQKKERALLRPKGGKRTRSTSRARKKPHGHRRRGGEDERSSYLVASVTNNKERDGRGPALSNTRWTLTLRTRDGEKANQKGGEALSSEEITTTTVFFSL